MQIARAPRSPLTKLLPMLVLFLVIAGAVSVVLLQQSLKNSQDTRNQAFEGVLPGEFPDERFPGRDGRRTDRSQDDPACGRAGCSGEICTDAVTAREIVRHCIWSPEFVCLQHTSCRVQANGQCGWTQTPEYLACMEDPSASPSISPSPSPSASPSEEPSPSPSSSPSSSPDPSDEPSPSPSPSPTFSRSDFNQDGAVDLLDYTILVSEFMQLRETYQADLNDDGKVDLLDYSLFVQDITL